MRAFGSGAPAGRGPIKADEGKVKQLMEMGFTKPMCKAALKKHRNNVDRALDNLLMNGDEFIGAADSEGDDAGAGGGIDQTQQALFD